MFNKSIGNLKGICIAALLVSGSVFAQGFVDQYTFAKPNSHNRMNMPGGEVLFAIPGSSINGNGDVVFEIKTIDNAPLDGVTFTTSSGEVIKLSGNAMQVNFGASQGRPAEFKVRCNKPRLIEFNWNLGTVQIRAQQAPRPAPETNASIQAEVKVPFGSVKANVSIGSSKEERKDMREERREERKEDRREEREERREDRKDKRDDRRSMNDSDNDEFERDGRFTTLEKPNAEDRINLDGGKNYFEIPKRALKRDWNWGKVYFQISAEDNKPLDGMKVRSDMGRPVELQGYSQQIKMDDPGKGNNLIFFIKNSENRKIRINWWMAN